MGHVRNIDKWQGSEGQLCGIPEGGNGYVSMDEPDAAARRSLLWHIDSMILLVGSQADVQVAGDVVAGSDVMRELCSPLV